jgi:hypothetical protein
VIPTALDAVLSGALDQPTRRDRQLKVITERGRLAWQIATDYGRRSLIETTMGRYKSLIGPRLRAHGFAAQQTAAAIGVAILNRMLAARRPKSARCKRIIAWRLEAGVNSLSIRQAHQRPPDLQSCGSRLKNCEAPILREGDIVVRRPNCISSGRNCIAAARDQRLHREPSAWGQNDRPPDPM